MAQRSDDFAPQLIEKLIPWVNKPISEHAINALAPGMDKESKDKLKSTLREHWQQCNKPVDHRFLQVETVEVHFDGLDHFVASVALEQFKRQQKLYSQSFTQGFKQNVDEFAERNKDAPPAPVEKDYRINGWRLDAFPIIDLRRRSGERLLVSSKVQIQLNDTEVAAKTINISGGGCLLSIDANLAKDFSEGMQVEVCFEELASQYALEQAKANYEVVNVGGKDGGWTLALKHTGSDAKAEFDQLIAHLMTEHKRRNRLDVNNTVRALTARYFNLAAVAQLNALMVLSHHADRYHLQISQGQSLNLQAQLLLSPGLLPHMVEQSNPGQGLLFFVWADQSDAVHAAELGQLKADEKSAVVAAWRAAAWQKLILVKAGTLDPQMAELGTSLPNDVAAIVSKLNAPLPVKVARLSKELAKITLLEDVTYLAEKLALGGSTSEKPAPLPNFRVPASGNPVRQVPFNNMELPKFKETFRFSQDCMLKHDAQTFNIVNGWANHKQAMFFLPLDGHQVKTGDPVKCSWLIDGIEISLEAQVSAEDGLYRAVAVNWLDDPRMVEHLFEELRRLDAFEPAFKEDVQAAHLNAAIRNLVLSNLPRMAIFADAQSSHLSLNALTGPSMMPQALIDSSNRAKLDLLFSEDMLKGLEELDKPRKRLLLLGCNDGKVAHRYLLVDGSDRDELHQAWQNIQSCQQHFVFNLDISKARELADDGVVSVERKYLAHYSPAKAKKLDASLQYNIAIELVEVSALFAGLMAL